MAMIGNRKRKKMNGRNSSWDQPAQVWVGPTRLAGIVVLVFFAAVIYAVLGHQCKVLNREVGTLEIEQRRLSEELNRERARWSDTKSPANLDRALRTNRISMQNPTDKQLIYITPVYKTERIATRN